MGGGTPRRSSSARLPVTDVTRFKVAVIGAGPAGLMAAEVLSAKGASVTICDRMPTLGRKLLMAGRGGLNLTHSEDLPAFLGRYGTRAADLAPAIEALPPQAVRQWCETLGQDTFVGTSGRVFPRSMKASPLLRAWLRRLAAQGVETRVRHRWLGWDAAGGLRFATPEGAMTVAADAVVLALGGASWPALGSDGGWVDVLRDAGIEVARLRPSNSGFAVAWSAHFRARFAGEPLKRIALSHCGRTVRGEAMLTDSGIEGGAIYALSSDLRDAIERDGAATLSIDLRPDIALPELERFLSRPRGKASLSSHLRKAAQLTPAQIGLLHEAALANEKTLGALTAEEIAASIKALPLRLVGIAPIARAISTAGGVRFEALDASFMLTRRPGVFVAGEMLDWEAPTGGYLLQACFATGAAAAHGALSWLAHGPDAARR
jgi:uncharacterized flavoprotein (TIGR03862 family)